MTSTTIDEVLKQLYPYLTVQTIVNSQYNQVQLSSLWNFFDKPFGHPVQISILRNENVIIYFQPLIQRLQIKIDQQNIIYEIEPDEDDELDINTQIAEIKQKYPTLDEIKLSDIRENSYIVIKWISLNHLQNIKVKSKLFGYYALHSLEMDQQVLWFNRKEKELTFYMKKTHQFRPRAFKFVITSIPSYPQKERAQNSIQMKQLNKQDQNYLVLNYFHTDNDGMLVKTDNQSYDKKQQPQDYAEYNQFRLTKEKEINSRAVLILHNFIATQLSSQKELTSFQFWIEILGYQYSKFSILDYITLTTEIVQHVEHQMPPQTYNFAFLHLLSNIIYYSNVYEQYNTYYGNDKLVYQKQESKNDKSNKKQHQSKKPQDLLCIARPFISHKYNNQQKQNEFDQFILSIDQNSIKNAIKLFEFTVSSKFTQKFDDTGRLHINGNLFKEETEEFNIINADIFQIIENIRQSDALKDHILRQKRNYVTALQQRLKDSKKKDSVLVMQKISQIRTEIDLNIRKINEIDEIFFGHYNQYLNELIVHGSTQFNQLESLYTGSFFRAELTAHGKSNITFYQQLVSSMYTNISMSQLHKQMPNIDKEGLKCLREEDIKQVVGEYLEYLKKSSNKNCNTSILDKIYTYIEIFKWISLQKKTQNVIYVTQIGFQATQQDDIIDIDEDELQKHKQIIQQELGHVYGIESQEIKYVVTGLTQTQPAGNGGKFKLSTIPSK